MTIRHLKTFIKVAELGSITKAANELNIAQPSVTQTIKELEDYYNIELFTRMNRGLVITDEGIALLAKAKEIIEDFESFESIANERAENPVIRIGATLTFGKRFIPEFVKILKNAFPDIDLYVCMDKTKSLEEKVLKGDLDFALCEGLTTHKDISCTIIKRDRLLVISGLKYDISDNIKFEDLNNYDLLLREKGSSARFLIDNIASKHDMKLKPLIESTSNYTIVVSVLRDVGIALLPYPIVKEYLNAGRMKEISIDTDLSRNLYIIRRKDRVFTGLKKKVISLCLKYIKELNEKDKGNI